MTDGVGQFWFDSSDLEAMLWSSRRAAPKSAWHGHVAFAHWLVHVASPKTIVELGTENGVSYAAFCHATAARGVFARCYAIDTWQGDEHTGAYSEEIFRGINEFNNEYYRFFSRLIRARFDDVLPHFPDGSIDLLHIDGLHTYDAVHHDFVSWKSKLSRSGVVLFHDTAIVGNGFGVWKLWSELSRLHPCFRFDHSAGLGVLLVGSDQPAKLRALCAINDDEPAHAVRSAFAGLSERARRTPW